MYDFEPAARTLIGVIEGVRDEQLEAVTPCQGTSVAGLLDHVNGFTQAFAAAAAKIDLPGHAGPSADADHLGDDWRTQIPDLVRVLASQWGVAAAWEGMTALGGDDLPAFAAGVVALNEVIVHGWDLAVATGQPYDVEPRLVEAVIGFVQGRVDENPEGTPGLFGPPVAIAGDAPILNRLLALTGRDPAWSPSA